MFYVDDFAKGERLLKVESRNTLMSDVGYRDVKGFTHVPRRPGRKGFAHVPRRSEAGK